jgi:hypothetical protein
LGFPTTRKRSLENVPDVTQKDPINTANKSVTVGRVENVFFNAIIFLFWVDIILFLILAIGTILHYIG